MNLTISLLQPHPKLIVVMAPTKSKPTKTKTDAKPAPKSKKMFDGEVNKLHRLKLHKRIRRVSPVEYKLSQGLIDLQNNVPELKGELRLCEIIKVGNRRSEL